MFPGWNAAMKITKFVNFCYTVFQNQRKLRKFAKVQKNCKFVADAKKSHVAILSL